MEEGWKGCDSTIIVPNFSVREFSSKVDKIDFDNYPSEIILALVCQETIWDQKTKDQRIDKLKQSDRSEYERLFGFYLWKALRDWNVPYERQYPVIYNSFVYNKILWNRCFLDFYVKYIRVAYEIDGPEHDPEFDHIRDEQVEDTLIVCKKKIIRYKNNELLKPDFYRKFKESLDQEFETEVIKKVILLKNFLGSKIFFRKQIALA